MSVMVSSGGNDMSVIMLFATKYLESQVTQNSRQLQREVAHFFGQSSL